MIKTLKDDYATRLLCEALDVHRCNLYHEPRPDEDQPVKDALSELAGAWPTAVTRIPGSPTWSRTWRRTIPIRSGLRTLHTSD